jgi:CHAD domain-containing protein
MSRHDAFALAPGADPAVIAAAVARRLDVQLDEDAPVEPSVEARTYLDTFDWALHNRGLRLWTAPQEDGSVRVTASPRPAAGDAPTRTAVVDRVPRFASDLEPGWFRDHLAAVTGDRALLPVAEATVCTWSVEHRNADEKLVARVIVEAADGRAVARAAGVRGYEKHGAEAVDALAEAAAESDAEGRAAVDLLDLLVPAAGVDPAKPDVHLDPDEPAAHAYVAVLRRLLDVLDATKDGTVAGTDVEFLHDYRVAIRRTRSALRQAKDVLPDHLLSCFRPELAWVQEITGPTRDLDVYLGLFTRDRADLPSGRSGDLDAVHDLLEERRTHAQAEMRTDLASARAAALFADWRETLAALAACDPTPGADADEWGPWPEESATTIEAVAAGRVVKRYRKLVRDGSRIDRHSHPEELHELRKAGKELRYLFELFGSVLPRETVDTVVKELKGLQDCLGDFQDTQVHQVLLTELGAELATHGRESAQALLALGSLVDRLERRRAEARVDFAERFARFSAKPVRARIDALAKLAR